MGVSAGTTSRQSTADQTGHPPLNTNGDWREAQQAYESQGTDFLAGQFLERHGIGLDSAITQEKLNELYIASRSEKVLGRDVSFSDIGRKLAKEGIEVEWTQRRKRMVNALQPYRDGETELSPSQIKKFSGDAGLVVKNGLFVIQALGIPHENIDVTPEFEIQISKKKAQFRIIDDSTTPYLSTDLDPRHYYERD